MQQMSVGPAPSLKTQSKMMAYDRVVADMNAARLRGTSFPVVHALIDAALSAGQDVRPFSILIQTSDVEVEDT